MLEPLHEKKLKFLEEKANRIREDVIETLLEAGSGHSAGPLGMADIFTALYFHVLNHNPKNPNWADRDRLVLSNGHICPVRYVAMAHAGYFPLQELKTLRKINSRLQGHPHRSALPGVETTSGPLGEGISQGTGMALAGKHKLNNLTLVIDRNNIQIDGFTENVMPLEPLKEKYLSFNWEVLEVDGNNIRAFINTVRQAR